ncbi:hypothetical protein [Janthinobacterium sp. B9-8]|uniref:hypothetical protein n=1 Tax=Janthinobacterium sp. B9-8 TaxID=1236179 RepID=UPI00061CE4D1|nr:hypothetical protein [Janthinobacterium sp. B9-8]AMC36619.1 hypothetical protein VN23_19495 [Janthinobacterium sp. B9-8]
MNKQNEQQAQHFVAATFELLAKSGGSLNYSTTAQVAEGLLGQYFDAFSEDDRYKMAAVVTALYLSTETNTGRLEPMTRNELQAASKVIGKGAKHEK